MDQHDAATLRNDYATAIADGDTTTANALAARLDLTPDQVQTHLAVRHHHDTDWLPDEFTNFTALPPGRFDPRVFNQTTWWVDILRQPHRINDPTDFDDVHLAATIGFLEDNAWRWAEPDYYDDPELSIDEWIYTTPLMRALRAEAATRISANTAEGS